MLERYGTMLERYDMNDITRQIINTYVLPMTDMLVKTVGLDPKEAEPAAEAILYGIIQGAPFIKFLQHNRSGVEAITRRIESLLTWDKCLRCQHSKVCFAKKELDKLQTSVLGETKVLVSGCPSYLPEDGAADG